MLRLSELKIKLDRVWSTQTSIEVLSNDAQKIGTERWLESMGPQATDPQTDLHRQAPQALLELVLSTLNLKDTELKDLVVHKRSFDARGAGLNVVYIVDFELQSHEAEIKLLQAFTGPTAKLPRPHLTPTPDMAWHPQVLLAGVDPQGGETPSP